MRNSAYKIQLLYHKITQSHYSLLLNLILFTDKYNLEPLPSL